MSYDTEDKSEDLSVSESSNVSSSVEKSNNTAEIHEANPPAQEKSAAAELPFKTTKNYKGNIKFYVGEMLPWKGIWFRIIEVKPEEGWIKLGTVPK